jgi:hypothetical protein
MMKTRTGWRRYAFGEKPFMTPQTLGVIIVLALVFIGLMAKGGF